MIDRYAQSVIAGERVWLSPSQRTVRRTIQRNVRWLEPCGDNFEPAKLLSGKLSQTCLHCGWPKRKHVCNCGCGLGTHI